MTKHAKGVMLYEGHRVKVRLQFEPRDLWMGVFWRVTTPFNQEEWYILHVYLTLVPMLPLHITNVRRVRKNEKDRVQSHWFRSSDTVHRDHGVSK